MLSSRSTRRRLAVATAIGVLAAVGLSTATVTGASAATANPHPVGGLTPSPLAAYAAVAGAPQAAAAAVAASVPASYDLTPWAVTPGDQGQVGSCVSWTVGYTISGWYARKQGNTGSPYAPMFLYSQVTGGHDVGSSFPGNLNLETSAGIAPQSVYTQGNYNYSTQPTAAEKTEALKYRLAGYTPLYGSKAQAAATGQALIKDAISHDKPIALGIEVYNNFFYVGSATDHYDAVSGSFAGLHAITALAYDAYGVKVENSWGTSWGKGGYAWLSWNFIAAHTFEAYAVNGFNAPVAGANPTVAALSATHGPWTGGTPVTLTGTNLTGASVAFGTAAATAVTVAAGGTSVTATVPTGAPGQVAVTVTTPAGKSNAVTYTYDAAVPTITSLAPASGTSAGGTRVTLVGTNLNGASVVFGTTPATAVTVGADGRSLTLTTPAGAVGKVNVTVKNTGGTSAAAAYAYAWPVKPVLSVTAPSAVAPGGVVTVSGSLKQPPTNTAIAKFAVTLEARRSGTTTPFAAIGTGVTAANGTVTFSGPLTVSTDYRMSIVGDVVSNVVSVIVVAPPTATTLSSTAGVRAGGQTVVITGTGLAGTTVTVNGIVARVLSVSADGKQLAFATPAAAKVGSVPVVVSGPTGIAKALTYTYR